MFCLEKYKRFCHETILRHNEQFVKDTNCVTEVKRSRRSKILWSFWNRKQWFLLLTPSSSVTKAVTALLIVLVNRYLHKFIVSPDCRDSQTPFPSHEFNGWTDDQTDEQEDIVFSRRHNDQFSETYSLSDSEMSEYKDKRALQLMKPMTALRPPSFFIVMFERYEKNLRRSLFIFLDMWSSPNPLPPQTSAFSEDVKQV